MKSLRIAGLALMLTFLAGWVPLPAAAAFPTAELGKLPYLYFSENNLGESCIFRMQPETCTIEADGARYVGFQFFSTGRVEWLFINTPGDLVPGDWQLINERGESVGTVERSDVPLEQCPRVLARYPQASRVTRYKTAGDGLDVRGRYHLIQKMPPGKTAPYAFSLASCSPGSYEAGRSGILIKSMSGTPLRDSTDVVIESMKALRREQGVDAAVAYLAREMELRIDDGENAQALPEAQRGEAQWSYVALYVNSWYEAQTGGGRLDESWAAAVYDVMYQVCLKRGYFARSDVAVNLTASLSLAARYGRLAEVLEMWKEGMRLGGYRMDITSYPDLGSAFSILPQVRKRNIPELAPYALAEKQGVKVMDRPHGLGENFIGCIENYANELWFQGQWQQSLEWLAWSHGSATDPKADGPRRGCSPRWHDSLAKIADNLSGLGFWEQALALHEHALRQSNDGGYEGRFAVRHQMRCLTLKMLMGRSLPENGIDQARACIARATGNIYEKGASIQSYQADLGELLVHSGRGVEGEALLDQLAAAGSRPARIARLRLWVKSGRVAGVEAELQQLLRQSREGGRKMDEVVFYRLYADFLEQQGRLHEALQIRRELVRLCKVFDIFTYLPLEMAKLSSVLHMLGIADESLQVANDARALIGKGGIPDHLARQALELLDDIARRKAVAAESDPAKRVRFQPLQSVVIPLKGASWVSHLTLTNPSTSDRSGTLRASGLPVRFRKAMDDSNDGGDILATLGGREGTPELKVTIEPASHQVIALDAADGFTGHGQLTLAWTPDAAQWRAESTIVVEDAIGGTTRAIIQAGAYQSNPFHGIPVFHHYVDTESAAQSRPMRFVSPENIRIEIYAMDGVPLAIDAQGNGSLRDAGDELFGAGDGQGNLRLPLAKGHVSFMLLIFQQRALPEEGLPLRVECLDGDQWQLYAEDRLMPAL